MKWTIFRPTSGIRGRRPSGAAVLLAGLLFWAAGCNYGFSSGGGFDSSIRTIYIQPFENTTTRFDLESQLYNLLAGELVGQLGLTTGSEAAADAMLRGRITRFEEIARTQPGEAGTITADEYQVQIVVSVELIDRRRNVIVWDGSSVTGRGDYFPSRETDEAAIEDALQSILEQIVNGAQSRW